MKKFKCLMVVTFSLLLVLTIGCGKKPAGKTDPKNPKVGDSCKGIGAMESRMACDGQKIIFCSSYSKYVYKMTQTCAADKKCTVAPDGKSASCK